MSALECLSYQAFAGGSSDSLTTEGSKAGVPRYDGDPTLLAEYAFRVRLLEARTRAMDQAEVKKQGPLGLKLIEGLTGAALQVAREISLETLASEKGPSELVSLLYKAFRPRRAQEARELYAAGAQPHGVLSRQAGEPMTSYLLRRRTWYKMLLDLDEDLRLPEGILAEQTLAAAALSHDYQLLIRTALQGRMSMNEVCDELIAQHSRVHEREVRHRGKGGGFRGGKGGKWGHQTWGTSYITEEDEMHSQSLSGFDMDDRNPSAYSPSAYQATECSTDYANTDYYSYYSQVPTETSWEEEDDPCGLVYMALLAEGLDEQNAEALDYAAEVIQIEAEAFFVQQRAQHAGHTGFSRDRGYGGKGKGKMTPEERKQRIDAIKRKTNCRRCGQVGHWSTDAACPKNRGKGSSSSKGSYGLPSTSTALTSKGGGKAKSSQQPKPRTVYFALNEYTEDFVMNKEDTAFMVFGRQVPPPQSLQEGIVLSPTEEPSADEMLDEAIARAQVERLQAQAHRPLPSSADMHPVPEDAEWEMTVEDVEQQQLFEFGYGGVAWQPFNVFGSQQGVSTVGTLSSTMSPGSHPRHPGNLRLHQVLHPEDLQGHPHGAAPTTPSPATTTPASSTLPSPTAEQLACPHELKTTVGTNAHYKIVRCADCRLLLEKTRKEPKVKMQDADQRDCAHARKDYRGTTATTWKWTCKDCGKVETGHKNPGERGSYSAAASEVPTPQAMHYAEEPEEVLGLMQASVAIQREANIPVTSTHLDIIYSKCKDLVYGAGYRSAAASTASASRTSPPASMASSRPRGRAYPSMPTTSPTPTTPMTPQSSAGPPPSPSVARTVDADDLERWHAEALNNGKHNGKRFDWVFEHDKAYCKLLIGKSRAGDLRDQSLIEFAQYAAHRMATAVAFMVTEKETYPEDAMVAVVDTGCNNTCHGADWLKEYMKVTGMDIPLEPAAGRFRGVGGKIKVAGLRRIPVIFGLENGTQVCGEIVSTELEGSNAPLLLSTKAQKSLGLLIDMDEHSIYSRRMNDYLELVDRDGLPGIRLLPGDGEQHQVALHAAEESLVEDGEADGATAKTEIEEEDNFNYVRLGEDPMKVMTKGQKKLVRDGLEEVEKEDIAMWAVLRGDRVPKKPQRLIPRGCGTALLELFSGAATLTLMVASMGFSVSEPVDIMNNITHDLLDAGNRRRMEQRIRDEDPLLLAIAPKCGPWSTLQNINLCRGFETEQKILEERNRWYPVIKWLCDVIEERLALGREVMMENPWKSLMWKLHCVESLMKKRLHNAATGEPLELQRLDQCEYGLVDYTNGVPHQKSTGLLLSSEMMKIRLRRVCSKQHDHSPLEGGNKTKAAERWPDDLCKQMAAGLYDEVLYGVLNLAFAAEAELEEREEVGPLDAVHGEEDLGPRVKRARHDPREDERAETMEETLPDNLEDKLMEQEQKRRREWLRLPEEKRLALRRLHNMTGHCTVPALIRMLRASGMEQSVLEAAQHFRCQACSEMQKEKEPSSVRPLKPSFQQQFNFEVSVDVFEVHDCQGHRHSILSIVDNATKFQVGIRVCGGGVPGSKVCSQAMLSSWINWAGAPKFVVADQGVHNKGRFAAMLTMQGSIIRPIGARAPFQLGTGERHGGILKQILKHAINEHQIFGADNISALVAESCKVKNHLSNQNGYAPVQWVLGYIPDDPTSMIDGEPEGQLGVHQAVVDAEKDEIGFQDIFQKQLMMRQIAKESYMRVDASQKIRKSMLRKSQPLRGPYNVGDLVSFNKKDRWFGPARILAHEGHSLWLIHQGVSVLVAETSVRPATTEEVLKKQLLELKPSRKRKRSIYIEPEDDDELPFSEDTLTASGLRGDGQVPYVDLRLSSSSASSHPVQPGQADQPMQPSAEQEYDVMREIFGSDAEADPPQELPLRPPPGLELPQEGTDSVQTTGSLPEPEEAPDVSPLPSVPATSSENPPGITPLTQALRRSPDALDGNFSRRREVSDSFLATKSERKYKKKAQKTQKTGAGMEINYDTASVEIQYGLNETMKKEWGNWEKYSDGRWITRKELEEIIRNNPDVKVIPTRWVHTNKAEPTQPIWLKSRLVVRGDLEDSSNMRCDSPTGSHLALSLVFALSASRDTDLWSGDISAAFLQGSKLDRILILKQPKGGIPGLDFKEEMFYLVSSTAYGTKDAPRGWLKNLDGSLKAENFVPVPYESAFYMLHDDEGQLAGLLAVHVDDLLWTGSDFINQKMKKIQERYSFGKVSCNTFAYCGREVVKDNKGVTVTCPHLTDRIRPIYLQPEQKKRANEMVDEKMRTQLRSVIGSLAWLARVCRPDLAYAVCRLQSSVHAATYSDIKFSKQIVQIAKQSKDKGVTYPLKALDFEKLMVVAIQDASHAADYDTSGSGAKLGHRSQSGRLLCIADEEFKNSGKGHMYLIEWHSTVLKRVCRSTLQAETLSLLAGSEEAEHLRCILYSFKEPNIHAPQWMVRVQDKILVDWYTDCRSLSDHANQSGLHVVTDKRLAIDLSGIRQMVWRSLGEEHGDPLLTDRVPADATTTLKWTSTDRMLADPLTKGMKHAGLDAFLQGFPVDLTPKENKVCENEEET